MAIEDRHLPGLLRQVIDIAQAAGEIIRRDFHQPKDVRHKGRIDLVTATDLAVEAYLKERLNQVLPEADFLAEETAAQARPGELTWIIDPVDGTTNFAHQIPFVASSVGLWHQGRVVLGVVHCPVLQECFAAARGHGATCNGAPIRVSAASTLEDSLVATGFPYAIARRVDNMVGNMARVLPAAQGLRRAGAASVDLAFTAAGRFEGFYEPDLSPWDTAAGWLLVEEAGGRVTRWDGVTPYTPGAPSILATNGAIHADLAELLQEPQEII